MTVPRSPQLTVSRSLRGGVQIVGLHGELDLATASELSAHVAAVLTTPSATVILDLRDLTFMDAHGIRALNSLRTGCDELGRQLALVRGQRAVHRLLALCGIEQTFRFADSVSEARELIGVGPRAALVRRGALGGARLADQLTCRREARARHVPDLRRQGVAFIRRTPDAGLEPYAQRRPRELG
jgi:anti-sigma B factor antagonist